jgi:uncharacterized membrane protein
MLGASYLLSLSLQHFIFLGLLVMFASEIMTSIKISGSLKIFFEYLSLVGLSIINLSFLHYSFTHELLLIQVLLSILMLALFYLSLKAHNKTLCERESGVYAILVVLLFIELIN